MSDDKDPTTRPKLEPFFAFKKIHNERVKKDKQRLGQRFCNMYLKVANPEMFYAKDIDAAILIMDWLYQHQYFTELPPLVEREW
jgi:hypothetical protein